MERSIVALKVVGGYQVAGVVVEVGDMAWWLLTAKTPSVVRGGSMGFL
jgi:hypothetical protein